MKNKSGLIFLLLVAASLIYLAVVIYQNRSVFTTRFSPTASKKLYDQSQWQQSQNISPIKTLDDWALKNHYTGWKNYVDENRKKLDTEKVKNEIIQSVRNKGISDTELYSYAGYEYIHGADPTLLNPEHPPLGKYLIGLSILLFGNENVILLICAAICLIVVYFLTIYETGNRLVAASAVFFTATQTLFVDQIIHGPQLEIFQLVFFLLLLLFLQKLGKDKRAVFAVVAGMSLGLFLSVKTVSTHYPLLLALLAVLLIMKRLDIKDFALLNAAGLVTFILTYASFFLHGGSLRKWLGVQKYIVIFYKQSGINIVAFAGNYLRLIFTGSWKFWSDNTPVSHYSGWSFMWIVVFLAAVFVLLKRIKTAKPSFIELTLICFTILYNGFLFIVPMFPRYLLLLFVPMILLIHIGGFRLISHEKKKQ